MPHGDEIGLSYRIGGTLRQCGDFGTLTDATVAAANTVAGINSAIDASVVHAEIVPAKWRQTRAVTAGAAIGDLTDALINPLTTVEGLAGLTAAVGKQNRDLLNQ